MQGMDTYSNILYVKEQFAALSHLAHRVAAADKYRPETCCIIGNYYSLKGQHEKAGSKWQSVKQTCAQQDNRTVPCIACMACGWSIDEKISFEELTS
jgi:hypothetical protein